MGSQKRWRSIQTEGSMVTWKTEGEELEGRFQGTKEGGQYGPIGTMKTDDGKDVAFGTTAALIEKLEQVPVGTYCKIVFHGMTKSRSTGRDYKVFDVFVLDEGSEVIHNVDEPKSPDDDIPF